MIYVVIQYLFAFHRSPFFIFLIFGIQHNRWDTLMDMGLRTQIISVQIICIACGKIGVGYVFPIESKEIFFYL